MSEKTILKLYPANGNFETVNTQLIQSGITGNYKFVENEITVPKIIEYPPSSELRNYFIEKTSVFGYLNQSGVLAGPSSEKERTSDYINVSGWDVATIRIHYYNIHNNYDPWIGIYTYNANKGFISTPVYAYHYADNKEFFLYEYKLPVNVAFIRVCSTQYDLPGTTVKISVERGETTNTKHYLSYEDMPSWVQDTGQPISFFSQGVVIKGDLIHTETGQEPEPEPEPPESDILFRDDFNRPDSITLGENWINGRGSWGIENGMVKPTTWDSIALCVHHHGDNVSISADVKRVRSDGVIFRGMDSNNHLYVQFENADFKLKSVTNRVVTTLKTYNLNSVINQTYRVRIELRGTKIKVFVDDVLVIAHETDAYLNYTLSGFQSWSSDGNNGRFDNFEIKRLV